MSRRFEEKFEEITEEIQNNGKLLDVILHHTQQQRLAAKADAKKNKVIRVRKEDAAADKKCGNI